MANSPDAAPVRPRIITDLDDPEFHRHFREFRYTAWRLETLQHYEVPYEAPGFAYFTEHGRLNSAAIAVMREWADAVIAPAVADGKYIGRVHVIEMLQLADTDSTVMSFTDYINFEMKEYEISKAAGEDVRILFTPAGKWPHNVWNRGHDFWLFDSSTLMEMHYHPDGSFDHAYVHNELTNPAAIVRANLCRDAAMAQSKPFYP